MATLRTSCPACGDVDLPADQVAMTYDLAQFVFQCPSCHIGVTKKTDARIIVLLRKAGVVVLGAPPAVRPPPITLDDLIDFGLHFDAEIAALLKEDA